MPQATSRNTAKYKNPPKPRQRVSPPVVGIQHVRKAHGWTLEHVLDQLADHLGFRPTKGALSAIELGIRGASVEMIEALAKVYKIPPEEIDTKYVPRVMRKDVAA